MFKTTLVLVIEHSKLIPELTDLAAGRIYTLDGVEDVTAELRPEAAIAKPAREIANDYQPLYDFALRHRVPFNELCSAVRSALNPALASQNTREAV